MTHCPHCDRCLPMVVSGETIRDLYEIELLDTESDVATRPVLVVVVETERAIPPKEPTTEPEAE